MLTVWAWLDGYWGLITSIGVGMVASVIVASLVPERASWSRPKLTRLAPCPRCGGPSDRPFPVEESGPWCCSACSAEDSGRYNRLKVLRTILIEEGVDAMIVQRTIARVAARDLFEPWGPRR